jgi:hypothetical protein
LYKKQQYYFITTTTTTTLSSTYPTILALFLSSQPPLIGPFQTLNLYWIIHLALLMILTCFMVKFVGLNNFYCIDIIAWMMLAKSINHASCFTIDSMRFWDWAMFIRLIFVFECIWSNSLNFAYCFISCSWWFHYYH